MDNYEISGGGIIREAMEDKQTWVRDKVMLRNYKWEKSIISPEKRAEKYNQKATLLLITGKKDVGKKIIAKGLENRLFADGKSVYFLGIGNVLYGVDADIKSMNGNQKAGNRSEHIRRLAEVAHIMLDAGIILIVTATELNQDDLEVIKTAVNPERILTFWVGDDKTTDVVEDITIPSQEPMDEAIDRIKMLLQDNGVIFKPW